MPMKVVSLNLPKESPADWDAIERAIKQHFKRELYIPLIKDFGEGAQALKNAKENPLYAALRTGRVTFSRGTFSGRFSAGITKELRALGATWDRSEGTFKAKLADLPLDTRNLISATESKFQEKIAFIDRKLAQILPEEIAERIQLTKLFDTVLWKADKNFQASIKGITVAPQLTPERRKKIAEEWQNNMQLYIKDFAEEEIKKLRANLQTSVFAGNRYDSAIETIQKSYGVSANKAKFLARQESKLLVTKFQEVRYADSGIHEYTWHAVAGSKAHPVRPRHKSLAEASKTGKIYRYDDPPITSEPDQPVRRNNPGQDYNCRCFSKPVVRFKK